MAKLMDLIKSGALIVDVRSEEEFAEGHHPQAINIPVDQVEARMHEFGGKDRSIVVYCASGARSAFAAKLLKMAGYAQVLNAGGLEDMPGL